LIADRFPGRERREKIPFPDEILEEKIPPAKSSGGEEEYSEWTSLQEERRLFYVGMTRAKTLLYLTWAKDYGLKRLKKVSPFVLETLDIPKLPEEVQRSSALEELRRYGLGSSEDRAVPGLKVWDVLPLSYFQVEDYLVCPLKYKFRHRLRIPVLPHHSLVFGRVLHNAIHLFHRQQLSGKKPTLDELLRGYEAFWINEGYLSREHEQLRKKAGRRALRRFFKRQVSSGHKPAYLEKSFKWQQERVRFSGRWDRIDIREMGAVIIDYKASEVKSQKEADKRAGDSLQMDLYALSFLKTQSLPLLETQLHFLESDIVGRAVKGEKEMARGWEKVKQAEEGIRSGHFAARPDWHNCSYCEYKTICPSTYAY
jgi:DNA helicase-2/ATP-dependent DNA helicase PcrA